METPVERPDLDDEIPCLERLRGLVEDVSRRTRENVPTLGSHESRELFTEAAMDFAQHAGSYVMALEVTLRKGVDRETAQALILKAKGPFQSALDRLVVANALITIYGDLDPELDRGDASEALRDAVKDYTEQKGPLVDGAWMKRFAESLFRD